MPFAPWHLMELALQPSQHGVSSTLSLEHGISLQRSGPCYSAFAGMEVVACAGVLEFWPGRAQVWSLLSPAFPQYIKSIHRAVRDFLAGYPVARLECLVDPRHDGARRWAERLGFAYEATMPKYTPGGETHVMLVRIR